MNGLEDVLAAHEMVGRVCACNCWPGIESILSSTVPSWMLRRCPCCGCGRRQQPGEHVKGSEACSNSVTSAEEESSGSWVHRTLVRLLNRHTEIPDPVPPRCGAISVHRRTQTGCDARVDHHGPHHVWWADITGEYTVIWEDR